MTLKDFIKTLSVKERTQLAEEIGITPDYLRQLGWSNNRIANADIAKSIKNSTVNRELPVSIRFTGRDYEAHREALFIKNSSKRAK